MAVLIALVLSVGLVAMDWRGKLDLTHPVGVLASTALFLLSAIYAAGWLLSALVELSTEEGTWWLTLLGAGAIALAGAAVGLYVAVKASLFPRGASPEKRAGRLLADGLAVGLPLQLLLIAGYTAASVALSGVFQGPVWAAPLYPLMLALLWPMLHLVFHVAIVAWMIDPLILWAAGLIGVLWTVQAVFLCHGAFRAGLTRREGLGKLAGRLVLALVPVVGLLQAVLLLRALGRRTEMEEKGGGFV